MRCALEEAGSPLAPVACRSRAACAHLAAVVCGKQWECALASDRTERRECPWKYGDKRKQTARWRQTAGDAFQARRKGGMG
ncbi:hypothetical protein D8B34_14240 [Verminephrobacter eiseniae]|nr:hypothetical protein [Verminephrobacter eiseniae]MCW5295067.1 hypothetical protein [Verminephrobacter eiseniae]MCW8185080.1 hypothetical protein [Verminephrobacter eiseniae]MCW8223782.1 hypothetical protein [Verminephrobacter eiseniae]MCW8234887.1 hypothetical protein [Verminephrobacter eiseniae]